jgi:NAD(P)-dependent dehydrogenase (short-subunit alcohol dehydrogenase family)
MRFKGKVVAVTGGSSGIGAACVTRFAEEGATVVNLDRAPGAGEHIAIDVADEASVDAAFAEIAARHGGTDVLVNSAGIGRLKPFFETTVEAMDQTYAVNVRGTFLCARAAARQMLGRGGGRIINLGSVSGRRGNAWRTSYAASKGAIVTMSEVMAVELAEHNILVNVIAPGPVETPLVAAMHAGANRNAWVDRLPLGRYARPAEIAGVAAFLAGPDASFITGHVLHADGGFLAGGLLPRDDRP